MCFTDEQQHFHDTSDMRGFKPLRTSTRLKEGELVSFKGTRYRIITKDGKPVMEEVVKERKGELW